MEKKDASLSWVADEDLRWTWTLTRGAARTNLINWASAQCMQLDETNADQVERR